MVLCSYNAKGQCFIKGYGGERTVISIKEVFLLSESGLTLRCSPRAWLLHSSSRCYRKYAHVLIQPFGQRISLSNIVPVSLAFRQQPYSCLSLKGSFWQFSKNQLPPKKINKPTGALCCLQQQLLLQTTTVYVHAILQTRPDKPTFVFIRQEEAGKKKKEQQSQRTAQTASASSTPSSQSKPGKCEVDSMVCRVGQNFRFFHFRLLQSASRYQENLQQLCHEVANLDEKQSPSRFSEVQRQQHHIAMPAR